MIEHGPEIIGREILRVMAQTEREADTMGKTRRREVNTRLSALKWALNVLVTGDTTKPPGAELEAFLGALKSSQ
ncbi:hypothetical protein [Streptomyces sp. NPDC058751]|uniref:hypothetical protein n=1 Tax=Streptomyces sp. NPDC058751 TaxID=3346623 RepID=UPI00367C1C21